MKRYGQLTGLPARFTQRSETTGPSREEKFRPGGSSGADALMLQYLGAAIHQTQCPLRTSERSTNQLTCAPNNCTCSKRGRCPSNSGNRSRLPTFEITLQVSSQSADSRRVQHTQTLLALIIIIIWPPSCHHSHMHTHGRS